MCGPVHDYCLNGHKWRERHGLCPSRSRGGPCTHRWTVPKIERRATQLCRICNPHDEGSLWRGNQGSGNPSGAGGAGSSSSAKKSSARRRSGGSAKPNGSNAAGPSGDAKTNTGGRRRNVMAGGESNGNNEEEQEEDDRASDEDTAILVADKQDDLPSRDLSNSASIFDPVEQPKEETSVVKIQEAGFRKQSVPRAVNADESIEPATDDQDSSREEEDNGEAVSMS